MDWNTLPARRWGLRPLGVMLLFCAYDAGRELITIGAGHAGAAPLIAYLLASVSFLCFSAGGALLVQGHHLFDRVEISERWRLAPMDHKADNSIAIPRDHLQSRGSEKTPKGATTSKDLAAVYDAPAYRTVTG